MIIFASTLINEVGTNGLTRLASYSSEAPDISTIGESTGVKIVAKNGVAQSMYVEPTAAPSPNRYLVSTVRLTAFSSVNNPPTFDIFGMEFVAGADPANFKLVGRAVEVCVIHDTTTGLADGYIGGRYVSSFPAHRQLRISTDGSVGSMSFYLSHLSIHSLGEAELVKPFVLNLIPIGSDQSGWSVPNTLEADLDKNNPTLSDPAVTTRTDGSEIRIAASGSILVEAAGSSTQDTLVMVQGSTLGLKTSQGAAPPLVVDATGTVIVTRISE